MDRKALYDFLSQHDGPRYVFWAHGVGCSQSHLPSSALSLLGHSGLFLEESQKAAAFTLHYCHGGIAFKFENWEVDEAKLVNNELFFPSQGITLRFLRATFTFAPLC